MRFPKIIDFFGFSFGSLMTVVAENVVPLLASFIVYFVLGVYDRLKARKRLNDDLDRHASICSEFMRSKGYKFEAYEIEKFIKDQKK
jgi:hypothetical protein